MRKITIHNQPAALEASPGSCLPLVLLRLIFEELDQRVINHTLSQEHTGMCFADPYNRECGRRRQLSRKVLIAETTSDKGFLIIVTLQQKAEKLQNQAGIWEHYVDSITNYQQIGYRTFSNRRT